MDELGVLRRALVLIGCFLKIADQSEVRWTPWYNTDQPTGIGDIEKLSSIRNITYSNFCEVPVHIEVRTTEGVPVRDAHQSVHYSVQEGFWCLNNEQNSGPCLDYKVRFLCELHTPNRPSEGRVKSDRWSSWSDCDVTCGVSGVQRRFKKCAAGGKRSLQCWEGEIEELRPCGYIPCEKVSSSCETNGTITDTSNIPLEGVKIGLGAKGGQGLTTITTTNEDGQFYVQGICGDSSSAHLMAHKRNYVTTRVHVKVSDPGKAFAKVRMMPAVYPTIYKHPVDKTRFVGQSVKFCCKSRGPSKDHIISWFFNGALVDVIRYAADPNSLEIHNLTIQDGGKYWCKIQSTSTAEKISVKSQVARLSVFDDDTSACNKLPGQKYIKIPNGCRTNETSVKHYPNSTYIDIGYCNTNICPSYHHKRDVCGESGDVRCCGPLERRLITVNCSEYSLPIYKVQSCGCQPCVRPAIKVQGRAFGMDPHEPLRFGSISIGNRKAATTSYDGIFSVDVPEGIKRLVLTFTDRFAKFVTTTKILPFKESGGVTYHEVKLPRKSPARTFHSRDGSDVRLSGIKGDAAARIVTPPNSFYTKDGRKYNGKVAASVTFIDPRNETSYEEAPSDLAFLGTGGEALPLKTYGMFEMDLRDENSNELNAGKVKVVLDKNTLTSSTQPMKLKLWSLNPESGMWEVEDDFHEGIQQSGKDSEGKKRPKREARTFLVGNLEIRERRLYNLDVPVDSRCWMKVRAYRSPEFVAEEQSEDVEITVINMEPEAGFRGNPQAWGRFDSALTTKNGACVRVFCHANPTAYKAIVTAKLDSSEELFAAPSGFPPDPQVIGVDGEILEKLEYRRSDHNEVSGKKTSFQTNLPKPKSADNLSGPIYPEENLRDCEIAPVTDNHFRFYRTEDYLYEYNTIYMDEHNCLTWTPHYLNWWPKPLEYRACYIKVNIDGSTKTVVRGRSSGGMHPETTGKLYGIRDDRSVAGAEPNAEGVYDSAACIEFKCSGMLYDMELPDRTLVTVVPQGGCQLHRMNTKLTQYLTAHPPTIEADSSSEFRMYAPTDPLGHNYGIYTVTADDPLIAKRNALGRCYAGSSDRTSRVMDTKKGVALYYRCFGSSLEDELP